MQKWHSTQNQPFLGEILKEPPIISFRKGTFLKDTLVRYPGRQWRGASERVVLVGERPLAQAVKSFQSADPITLPVISPELRFDPGNLIGQLEKRFLEELLLVRFATILTKPVLQSFP